MRRVLLLVAALAALSLVMSSASASGTASCGADLSVHNAAACTSTTQLVGGAEPTLSIDVAIGPLEGMFSGDVRAVAKGVESGAERHLTCVYRADNGLGALGNTCLDFTNEVPFVEGEAVTCSGVGSGVGAWKVNCAN